MPKLSQKLQERFTAWLETEYEESLLAIIALANRVITDDKLFEAFAQQVTEHHDLLHEATLDDLREMLVRSLAIVSVVNAESINKAKAEAAKEDTECELSGDISLPPSMTMV